MPPKKTGTAEKEKRPPLGKDKGAATEKVDAEAEERLAAAAEAKAKARAELEAAEAKRREREKKAAVDLKLLHLFVFPPKHENPESTGRLELFARHGPVDGEGKLRSGIRGDHVCTDFEIRQMITHETREALFAAFNRPRSAVELMVDELMPMALAEAYTWAEVKELLKDVPVDDEGRMNFTRIQRTVLVGQRRRLQVLVRDGVGSARERRGLGPFQNKGATEQTVVMRRRKLNEQEEEMARTKRLGNVGSLVAGLETMNDARSVFANATMARPLGDPDDRWDRYCSIRKAGKSSHVWTRNTPRIAAMHGEDGMADRHVGCSSLVAALLSAR